MANMGSLIPVKSAGCGQLAQGFYKQGRLEDEYHLKTGDIVFFNWNNGTVMSDWVPFPSVDHVGICVEVKSNGNFISIEGNTNYCSTAPYGEVKIQTRNIAQVSCVAHPAYTSSMTADMVIETAKKEVGTKATAIKKCKYNTWYYGTEVSGDGYDWCATKVCWDFYHTEEQKGGNKTVNIVLRTLSDNSNDRLGQIKNIQRILRCCGYDGADGKPLEIDGVKGKNTKFAIKAWKKNHGFDYSNADMSEKELKDFYSSD